MHFLAFLNSKLLKIVHFSPKIFEKVYFLNLFKQKLLEKVRFLNIFKHKLFKKRLEMTTFYLFYTPKLLKLTCFYLKSYIFKHFQTKQYLKKTKNVHFFFCILNSNLLKMYIFYQKYSKKYTF